MHNNLLAIPCGNYVNLVFFFWVKFWPWAALLIKIRRGVQRTVKKAQNPDPTDNTKTPSYPKSIQFPKMASPVLDMYFEALTNSQFWFLYFWVVNH